MKEKHVIIDATMASEVWEAALSTSWKNPPVWVHGDISAGNLLVRDEKLSTVILTLFCFFLKLG